MINLPVQSLPVKLGSGLPCCVPIDVEGEQQEEDKELGLHPTPRFLTHDLLYASVLEPCSADS